MPIGRIGIFIVMFTDSDEADSQLVRALADSDTPPFARGFVFCLHLGGFPEVAVGIPSLASFPTIQHGKVAF